MPKLFCISDVHGFYDEMIAALNEAGFNPNDESHWLISGGDHIDRGDQPAEVMKYLMSLPRKILIKGNHEELLVDCCERGYAMGHDFSNGTFDTINELGDAGMGYSFDECCTRTLARVHMFLDNMVNYFETKNYIFVHSFVPLNSNSTLPPYYLKGKNYTKMDNWREANNLQWEDSRWGNPYELAAQDLLPDKTLVFGHWHTSWPRHEYEGKSEFGHDADFSPYYGDGYIGIDACVAHSGKINVLVLEDEFMEGEVN